MRHPTRLAIFLSVVTLVTAVLATACGGGGGGGGPRSSNDPGEIALWLERGAVDSGDLCRVRVDVFNPNPDGVVLKFRFPTSIRYSKNSAVLFPGNDDERFISPSFETTAEDFRYVVFMLSEDEIRYGEYSTLELNLKAIQADPDAIVAVDIDNNDPNVPDSREFDLKRPRFTAVEELGLEIRGDLPTSGTPSPTPTAGSN